jgi:uncharacterized protein (TIGR00369 family)
MLDEYEVPEGFKHFKAQIPAEDNIGPFFYRKLEDELQLGMRATEKHTNGNGAIHGGVLLAFADYAVSMLALRGVSGESCVTVSLNSDFMAAARVGDWIAGSGEVVRRTGSMTFVRGQLAVEDSTVLNFQAVVRRLKRKD